MLLDNDGLILGIFLLLNLIQKHLQMEVWSLIIQKFTVIPPSSMVLFPAITRYLLRDDDPSLKKVFSHCLPPTKTPSEIEVTPRYELLLRCLHWLHCLHCSHWLHWLQCVRCSHWLHGFSFRAKGLLCLHSTHIIRLYSFMGFMKI